MMTENELLAWFASLKYSDKLSLYEGRRELGVRDKGEEDE
jgi:hypothetical protein